MNAYATIKGWCPTALRPMMSGDGLLVRVRIRDATLSPAHALALADASERFGNGLLDVTQRANIQIRGVRPECFAELLDLLLRQQLVDPREIDVPINILVDPLCGLDESKRDMRPLAAAVERALLIDERFAGLPSKFGFSLDGGSVMSQNYDSADVFITAATDGNAMIAPAGFGHAAHVSYGEAPAAALALARAFLVLRRDERRMRALAFVGAEALFGRAGFAAKIMQPQARSVPELLGLFTVGNKLVLGVAAPFGAWRADDLAAIAHCVATHSGSSIRVTPSRVLLVAGLPDDIARDVFVDLAARGLIVDADDARRRIAACAGAPACSSGAVETRTFAATLAPKLPSGRGIAVHVSGCAKGCAHPRGAPVTYVGRNGRFDLVLDGRADDAPTATGLDSKRALAILPQQRAA